MSCPIWKSKGGGTIVNIASIGGIRFTLPNIAYAASKAAVIALTRDVALQYAAKEMARQCLCGIFNPARAAKLLAALADVK